MLPNPNHSLCLKGKSSKCDIYSIGQKIVENLFQFIKNNFYSLSVLFLLSLLLFWVDPVQVSQGLFEINRTPLLLGKSLFSILMIFSFIIQLFTVYKTRKAVEIVFLMASITIIGKDLHWSFLSFSDWLLALLSTFSILYSLYKPFYLRRSLVLIFYVFGLFWVDTNDFVFQFKTSNWINIYYLTFLFFSLVIGFIWLYLNLKHPIYQKKTK